jgi:hypothetical protein
MSISESTMINNSATSRHLHCCGVAAVFFERHSASPHKVMKYMIWSIELQLQNCVLYRAYPCIHLIADAYKAAKITFSLRWLDRY